MLNKDSGSHAKQENMDSTNFTLRKLGRAMEVASAHSSRLTATGVTAKLGVLVTAILATALKLVFTKMLLQITHAIGKYQFEMSSAVNSSG